MNVALTILQHWGFQVVPVIFLVWAGIAGLVWADDGRDIGIAIGFLALAALICVFVSLMEVNPQSGLGWQAGVASVAAIVVITGVVVAIWARDWYFAVVTVMIILPTFGYALFRLAPAPSQTTSIVAGACVVVGVLWMVSELLPRVDGIDTRNLPQGSISE